MERIRIRVVELKRIEGEATFVVILRGEYGGC